MTNKRTGARLQAALLLILTTLPQAVWGQAKDSAYYRFQLDGNVGYLRFNGNRSAAAASGPGGGFTLGYRANKHFLIESGLDYMPTALFPEIPATASDGNGKTSSATITNHTLFVPIGGRVLFPLQRERILLSAGGGIGLVRNFDVAVGHGQIDCNGFCSSRATAGPYETVQALFMVDKANHFGVGFGARMAQVKLKSDSFNSIERNKWMQINAVIAWRF